MNILRRPGLSAFWGLLLALTVALASAACSGRREDDSQVDDIERLLCERMIEIQPLLELMPLMKTYYPYELDGSLERLYKEKYEQAYEDVGRLLVLFHSMDPNRAVQCPEEQAE